MLYFLFWLVTTIIHATDCLKFKYLIFLTQWSFIAWNSYLILATLTVTTAYYQENWSQNSKTQDHEKQSVLSSDSEVVHSGRRSSLTLSSSPLLSLLCKLHWALFLIGGEYAVVVTTLYWVFYSSADSKHNLYSMDSLHLHTINGIFAVVDLWMSGIPVRLYHALYVIAFGCVYVLFTVLYYLAGGKNPEGESFIYPFLDYSSKPEAAAAMAVGCAVFCVGAIHFIFFLHYVLRKAITVPLHQSHCWGGVDELRSPKETLSKC